MARLHPGVYVEEVPSGVRPIEGVGTSTAAFIGKAETGLLNKAVLITSFQEFEAKYGAFLPDSFLAHSVLQFFNNGGRSCYIVRVAGKDAKAAKLGIKDRSTTPVLSLTIEAATEGAWANKIDLAIVDSTIDPDNQFAIEVYRDRSDEKPQQPPPPLLLEKLDDLSMDKASFNFVKTVVAARSKYIKVTVDAADTSADKGSSRSGPLQLVENGAAELKLGTGHGGAEAPGAAGTPATAGTSKSDNNASENLDPIKRSFLINIDDDGDQPITLPPEPNTGPLIAKAIEEAVRRLKKQKPTTDENAFSKFTCSFDTANKSYLLTSGTTGTASKVVVNDFTPQKLLKTGESGHFEINLNDDGFQLVKIDGEVATIGDMAAKIAAAVKTMTARRPANELAYRDFKAEAKTAAEPGNPSLLLTSGLAGINSSVRVRGASTNDIAARLKLGLANGGKETSGHAVLRPARSKTATEYHLGDAIANGNVASAELGKDGDPPIAQDYSRGLIALDGVRDVSVVTVPGISDPQVISEAVNKCRQRGDCFFIGDIPDAVTTVQDATRFIDALSVKSSYGAVYFPWLKTPNPLGGATPILAPPSGFVAGMYARIDAKRGVWKAPAGTEANVGGAIGLAAEITDAQQDFLNPIGANVIRSFPASGLVIWGARTLATKSDPEYRYIPVRRTAIFLEQSIYNGIQYAVFEPNDEPLWASLRLNITAFMMRQFRAGAFQGRTASDAFFVKCDNQTTTQADIDAGTVNILVGFAPLKPAEFVVLKLTQKTGEPAV
jgi:phage tail sheath protein FI